MMSESASKSKKKSSSPQIVMLNPNSLTPYENNPRLNEDAVDYVANSIKEFGFRNPIIVDKDMVIIAGHTRQKAALKLKLKEVPVIIAADMSESEAKAFRLADNKTAEAAGWDFELLDIELADLETSFDMESFGFAFDEEDDIVADESGSNDNVVDTKEEFKEYSEDTETKHKCPSCGYEWN